MASITDTITRLPVTGRRAWATHGTLAWVRWLRVPTGCVRIPRRSNVGGGGKDSVKLTEIGNMNLFCLFNVIFAGTFFCF